MTAKKRYVGGGAAIGAMAAILGLGMPTATARPPRPGLPGPASGRPEGDRLSLQEACVGCHVVQAEQWTRSGHAQSFLSETFARALVQEPLPFCRGCHAPEADPRWAPPPAAAAVGVGCVSCHVVEGEILAGPARSDHVSSPHPLRRDPRFTTADACASCHEFAFSNAQFRHRPELMQSTVSEHRRSPFADVSCATCHMPSGGGHRDHSFAASRDPQVLREAAKIEAKRVGPCEVEVSLTAKRVGHAFPTGDLMRRLEVELGTEDGWRATRYLARHWGASVPLATPVRVELSDDRVGPGPTPRRVRFIVPRAHCEQTLAWSVHYQRVQEVHSARESAAVVVGDVLLARGDLPPLSSKENR